MRELINDAELINSCNKDGYTVLHYASRYNRFRMIELLVEHGGGTTHQLTYTFYGSVVHNYLFIAIWIIF